MFLHPQQGFWKNAEPVNKSFNEALTLKGINANAEVYFDDRLVPHIYAQPAMMPILYKDIYMQNFDCFKWNFKPM